MRRFVAVGVLTLLTEHHLFLLLNKAATTAKARAKKIFDSGAFDVVLLLDVALFLFQKRLEMTVGNAIFLSQLASLDCLDDGTGMETTQATPDQALYSMHFRVIAHPTHIADHSGPFTHVLVNRTVVLQTGIR